MAKLMTISEIAYMGGRMQHKQPRERKERNEIHRVVVESETDCDPLIPVYDESGKPKLVKLSKLNIEV